MGVKLGINEHNLILSSGKLICDITTSHINESTSDISISIQNCFNYNILTSGKILAHVSQGIIQNVNYSYKEQEN